jgi:signal transduction histidine kinase
LVIPGDRELLAQCIVNLLENAQSHTDPGIMITLSASSTAENVVIEVADTGPGVAKADRERIVQRFIRLEASRSTPGHGLGLNLVAAVARLHGGRLRFAANRPGLRAILEFPWTAN